MERAVPVLPDDDLRRAREFYVDQLGFTVESADAYYDEWRARRVSMKRPPANEEWGARTFGVTDPFGNRIFVIGPLR